MVIHKIYQILSLIFGMILFPLQLVLNLILNLLSNLGIFFVPILLCFNLIYLILLGIILVCSWLYIKIPFLGVIPSIIGIPTSILASFVVSAVPALDGLRERFDKLLIIDFYPYSLDWVLMTLNKKSPTKEIQEIFDRMNNPALKPLAAQYIFEAQIKENKTNES